MNKIFSGKDHLVKWGGLREAMSVRWLAKMNWYCLKSKVRSEQVALACLSDELGVDCFLPLARVKRRLRGVVRLAMEPLFPGYLFARLDLSLELRKVSYARGVSGFVRLGERYPVVGDEVIGELQELCEEMERAARLDAAVKVGDAVEFAGKLFVGSSGVVSELLPAKNRIRVLVEFLSRSVEVEVDAGKVVKTES